MNLYTVKIEELNDKIIEEKNAGRRILALAPSKMVRKTPRSNEYQVIEYVLSTM